jgi:glucose dehydrogenase
VSPRFAVQSLDPRMHIVIVGWIFITFTMALTMRPLAGAFFFVMAGLVPVLLYAALALRRRRAARPAPPTAPVPRARSR